MEESFFRCIPQRKKPLPLYPTTEKNIFHCGIQWKKTCGVVGYNAEDFSGIQYTAQNSVEV
jgi:hypothetical protein